MSSTHWHFRRMPFSQDMFSGMVNGPSRAFTLFGRRRIGKTEWLLSDLADIAANTYGHRVAYVSFYQLATSPVNLMIYRLAEALAPKSTGGRIASWVGNLPVKAKIKSPDGTAELEIDLSSKATAPTPKDILLLDKFIARFANDKKPGFLLLDEFQELGDHENGPEVVGALRTSLDTAGRGLVTVFTGSSRDKLRKMFEDDQLPFFKFAAPIELPPLGDAFFDHQVQAFGQSYRRPLDTDAARARFEDVQRNPELFQKWLQTYGSHTELSPDEAAQRVDQQFSDANDFDRQWRDLSDVERQVMWYLTQRSRGVYSRAAQELIAKETGGDPPSKTKRQTAVRRLENNDIIETSGSGYAIADPAFEDWIKKRPKVEFM